MSECWQKLYWIRILINQLRCAWHVCVPSHLFLQLLIKKLPATGRDRRCEKKFTGLRECLLTRQHPKRYPQPVRWGRSLDKHVSLKLITLGNWVGWCSGSANKLMQRDSSSTLNRNNNFVVPSPPGYGAETWKLRLVDDISETISILSSSGLLSSLCHLGFSEVFRRN